MRLQAVATPNRIPTDWKEKVLRRGRLTVAVDAVIEAEPARQTICGDEIDPPLLHHVSDG
ncbi:hypothetical protein [Bradyrhizobium sp. CCBAU 53415]|uniref:hypothetical protein n=1 Tax=Bradyrhizobium sp. CCBAU 53415 TaxID=1325119 RepID=UPI002306CD0D|nr:hypothetical protein [Bradyrhizobium sp. CCBAU 53415]MDA9463132.1 hypothetical protein [Bradyrhizobium sp. CCBAU 53415]